MALKAGEVMDREAATEVVKSIYKPCPGVTVDDDMVTTWLVGGLAHMSKDDAMVIAEKITGKWDREPTLRDFQNARDAAQARVEMRIEIPSTSTAPTEADIAKENLAQMRARLQ